jgi:ATP-dependent Clp protease ATP-binding subunit ClpA
VSTQTGCVRLCWLSSARRCRRGEGSEVFERFTEQAHLILDLARDEAERCGHRYLGPEHVLLGVLAEGQSAAARVLRVHGMDLEAARAGLLGLARQGVVPSPRPSDAELLAMLGIDLDAVRRSTEQVFGFQALGEATWRVTRRRGWRGGRVVWTPLCGPPLVAKRALQLASEQAGTLGPGEVGPEHLVLGVLEDARQPAGRVTAPRRHRRITAHVGLPDGYRGAAGPLLGVLEIDLEQLWDAVSAVLRQG